MSRSYKKHPINKDGGKSKKEIRSLANRKVRRKLSDPNFGIANGKAYKKEFESWDIADCISRWTKEEAIAEYEEGKFIDKERFPTLESWINFWEKCMIRK